MCGISGFVSQSPSPSLDTWLSTSISFLAPRGPDDSGLFFSNDRLVGLGHTRLAIVDPSASGSQPFNFSNGEITLIFNGEIYNHDQYRSLLESVGFVFQGTSDTETLAFLYHYFKSSYYDAQNPSRFFELFLNSLNGIFSFSIFDSSLNKLFLARDPFGVKPLYYLSSPDSFLFASEIKALPIPSPNLDSTAISLYLTYLWGPGSCTPSPCIKKLPPGHFMTTSPGSLPISHKWFDLPIANIPSSSKKLSFKSSLSGTRHYLRQAVHSQMVSDVPLGCFLSGGLDSTSIAYFAREINPSLQCFTINVNSSTTDGFVDDLPYARQAARFLKVPLHVVDVQPSGFVSAITQLVGKLDEPQADPAALNVYLISKAARTLGFKVLLSGAAGDDLFSGYRRHYALSFERYLSILPQSQRQQLQQLCNHLPSSYPLLRRLRKLSSGLHLDPRSRLVNYFRWLDYDLLSQILTPEFRSQLHSTVASDPLVQFLDELPSALDPLDQMLALEQRFFLTDHNLAYTDKMSMAAGVEVRVPFLDNHLSEFSSFIPSSFKQRGPHGKWILKKAMEPYLPHNIIYRPKTGFALPIREWLQQDLREWLHDILSPRRISARGIFSPPAVKQLIDDTHSATFDHSYTLLSIIFIELWCTHFLDESNFPSTLFAP